MSTDKDAMREKAREWFGEYGQLVCYGHRPDHETDYDPSRCAGCVDSLAALLAAERADAVAQEREACAHVADNARIIEFEKRMSHSDTVMLAYNIAKAIRARTTTPTPSEREPSEGSSPEQAGRASGSPSGEQPGVGLFDGHLTVICAADYPVMVTREQGFYVIEVIDWPGCVAHGSTPNEAFENLSTVKEIWAKDCIERGIAIPRVRACQPRADYDAGESGEKI